MMKDLGFSKSNRWYITGKNWKVSNIQWQMRWGHAGSSHTTAHCCADFKWYCTVMLIHVEDAFGILLVEISGYKNNMHCMI